MLARSVQKATAPLARAYANVAPSAASKTSIIPYFLGGLGVGMVAATAYYGFPSDPHAAHADELEPAVAKKQPAVALTKDKFQNFKLTQVSDYNHNTKKYHFSFPDSEAVAGGPITHCIMVRAPEDGKIVDDKGKDIARPYTPISSVDHPGELVLLIKKYDTGKLTPWLSSLKIGDEAAFKGPFAKFPYKPSTLEQGIAIAGGSGITPMYQLIEHALSKKDDNTKWTLIYSNVTEEDILLRKEWDALAKSNPDRLKVVYALDNPPAGWTGPSGYVTPDLVKSHAAKAAIDAGDKVKVFVCGPPGQVAAIAGPKDGGKQGPVGGALKELGYEAGQVFKF